jgi:hypothetical protein
MKKIILIATLIASLTGLSAFGQGYFQFVTGKSQVWDCFTSGSPQLATTVNVAFLWAANGSVPVVASLYGSTPTSGLPPLYAISAAWSDILTDPNYTFAANSGNGQVAVTQSTSSGALNYGPLAVTGTMVGTTYSLFMVGWDANYATPVLASAANAAVGWSASFSYTAYAATATSSSMSGLTPAFGVWGVPEPSTLALAGLGSLSLLLVRRRK